MTDYERLRGKVVDALSTFNNSVFNGWDLAPREKRPASEVHLEIDTILSAYRRGLIDLNAIEQSLEAADEEGTKAFAIHGE